jgi:5-methyltetrahydrofolate--homocysteine methyltransferase
MSAPDEMRAAAQGATEAGMAYTVTGSFDMAGRTMMGMHPKDIHGVFAETSERPVAVGANCGVGAPDILSTLLNMSGADPDAILIVKGNCGVPEKKGDDIVYSGTPDLMADYVHLAIDAGATIIGGCCGTSCDHLRAMRTALDSHQKGARPTLDDVVARIGPLRNKPAPENSAGPRGRARERKSA